MELPINHNDPQIAHIDLNSCFASVEQQANPLLRGKPIAVAAYTTPNGCILAPSIEAKREGIRVGMRVRDAKLLYKNLIVLPPDPPKYRDVHMKLRVLLRQYSSIVVPKSIDEAMLDFSGTPALKRGLFSIGLEIKQRIREEIGDWLRVNVGIGTNRFLAKLAASLHKPDGLDVITSKNILAVYREVSLKDLNGINTRFEARLNANGIFTPLDFFHASVETLKCHVFKSILGYYWYLRLRGWEVDDVEFRRKSYGQSYALHTYTNDPYEISQLLMKLCEKMGRRLRSAGYCAYGIYVSCVYDDHTYWHQGITFQQPLYATSELFTKAQLVLNHQPVRKKITNLAVSCYNLDKTALNQLDLFDTVQSKQRTVAKAADAINDKYGEYVITPALMMGLGDRIIDRISYGGVKELEDIYDL